jgi:hypothetical protein
MRTARLDRTETCAASLDCAGELGRGAWTESWRPFGSEIGLWKWPTRSTNTRAVIV